MNQIKIQKAAFSTTSRGTRALPLQSRHGSGGRNCRQSRCIALSASVWEDDLPYSSTGGITRNTEKVQDYLKNPFDLAVFGPRLAIGALLSAEETARTLQDDIERATSVLQGPRPAVEKQELLAKEAESRITNFLQKGVAAEADLLTAITALLPEDVQRQLPGELRGVVQQARAGTRVPPTPPTYVEAEAVPIASVAKNQTAAEMVDLRDSVANLKRALGDLSANMDPAQEGVLKVNVIDARASLSRRLAQLSPAALSLTDAPVGAAREEARRLLSEVDTLRL